jgi:hypothetical protein
MFGLLLKIWKGISTSKELLSREGVRFLGWDRLWGMRDYELGTTVRIGTLT